MDASQNRNRWESQFSNRLFQSLQRSKLQMCGEAPISDIPQLVSDTNKFNIILLCSHKPFEIWNQIETQPWLSQKIFTLCCWESYDPEISRAVMQSGAASVIVPESPTSPREAGLFYLKFLTELDLHSADQISGKMIWFSFAKAKELLKKRRYNARFNVLC
jgi:hypothetical protein